MPGGILGNKYVAGIVGILLVLVIVNNAKFFLSRKKISLPPENVRQLQKKPETLKQRYKPRPEPLAPASIKVDRESWKRDPFSLPSAKESRPPEIPLDLTISGIIKRDGLSHILINGKVYGINDRIGTAVITRIKQHSIEVMTEGRTQEVAFDDYKVIKEKKK